MILLQKFLLARLIPIAICFLCGLIFERMVGVRAQATTRHMLFNTALTLIYQVVDFFVSASMLVLVAILLDHLPHRPLLIHSRPGAAFAVLLAVIVSLSGDLGYYWFHRWQHSSKWLWPMHELHHSDECVNVTTNVRRHWLESAPIAIATTIIPALFLPKPLVVMPLAYLLSFSHGFVVHFNCPMNLGWFNRLIVTPPVHRIHHSTLPEHFNKNFSGTWPIWDIVFGTYASPRKDEHVPTGLLSSVSIESIEQAYAQPFLSWRRLWSRARTATGSN